MSQMIGAPYIVQLVIVGIIASALALSFAGPAEAQTPPTFTARTATVTEIDVVFSQVIQDPWGGPGDTGPSPFENAAFWLVDGVAATGLTPYNVTSGSQRPYTNAGETMSGHTIYTLRVAAFGVGDTPTVRYDYTGSGGQLHTHTTNGPQNRLHNSANTVLPDTSTPYPTATDGIAPFISNAMHTGGSVFTIDVGETVTLPTNCAGFSVELASERTTTLGTIMCSQSSNTISLTTATAPAGTTGYVIVYPGLSDSASNTAPGGELPVTTVDLTPPALSAQEFTAQNRIEITISEAPGDTNLPGTWTVVETSTASNTLGDVTAEYLEPAGASDAHKIALVTENLAVHNTGYTINHPAISDAVPVPNTLSAGSLTLTFTDTYAPTFEAALTDAETITITFNEPVSGTTAASEWSVPGNTSVSVSSTMLSSATSLDLGIGARATDLATAQALTAPGITYTPSSSNALADVNSNPFAAAGTAVPATDLADEAGPTFSARLVYLPVLETPGISITFSEPVSGTTSAAQWAIGDQDLTLTSSATLSSATSLSLNTQTPRQTADLAGDPALTAGIITYTPPSSGALADAAGNGFGAANAAVSATGLTDAAPPRFEAALTDAETIEITFNEPVDGSTAVGQWAVANHPLASVSPAALDGGTTLELRLASPRATTDSTSAPALATSSVTYTVPSTGAFEDASGNAAGSANDAIGNTRFGDSAQPTFEAALRDKDTVRITFSENVGGATAAGDWSVAGSAPSAVSSASLTNARTLDLTLADSRATDIASAPALTAANIIYTAPSSPLGDPFGNLIAASGQQAAATDLADEAPPTFSAELTTANMITITFSEPISGRTAANEWRIDGTASSAVSPATISDPVTELVLTRAGTHTGTGLGSLTAADITFRSTFNTFQLADESDNLLAAASTTVAATDLTDGVAPTFRAALTSANTITITFSEPVSGITRDDHWNPTAGTLHSLDSDPLTLTSATSLDLTLRTPRTTDIILGLPLTASGIRHFVPAQNALADASGNPLGASGDTVTATAMTDEAPPVLTTAFATTTGPDDVSPRTITISVSEIVANSCDATFAVELASDRTMNLGDVTCAYHPGSRVITLTTENNAADRTDYVITHSGISDSAGNMADNDLEATSSDYTPPTFKAELVSLSEYRIIFNEAVSGTTSPGDWTITGDTVRSVLPSSSLTDATEITLRVAPRALTTLEYRDANNAFMTLSASDVSYTSSNPLANGVGLLLGGAADTAVSATALADEAPPEFVARTATASEVDVIFTERIEKSGGGTQNAAYRNPDYWTVGGATPAAVATVNTTSAERPYVASTADGAYTVYTLTAGPFASDERPVVQYMRPGSSFLADAVSNPVPDTTVTASDGIAPVLLSAALTSNNMITLAVSETIRTPGPGFSVFAGTDRDATLGAVTSSYSASSNEIMLTTEFSIESGTMYSIDYPELTDRNGNTAPASGPGESTPNAIRTADLNAPRIIGAEFEFHTDEFTNGKDPNRPDSVLLYLVFDDLFAQVITVSETNSFSVNGEPARNAVPSNNRMQIVAPGGGPLTFEGNTVYTVAYPDITDPRRDTNDDGNSVGDDDDATLPAGSVVLISPDFVPPTLGAVAFTGDGTVTVEASEPLRDPSSLVFCLEEDDTTGDPPMRNTMTEERNSCPKADGNPAPDLGAITVSQDPSDHTLTLTPEIAPEHGKSYILHIPDVYDLSEARFEYSFHQTTVQAGFFINTVSTHTTNIESLCNRDDTDTDFYVCKDSGLLLAGSIYGAGADPALTYTDTVAPEVSEITLVTPNVLDIVFNEKILNVAAVSVVQGGTTHTHASIDTEDAVAPRGNLTRVTFANTAGLGAGTAAITITGVQDSGSNAFPSAAFDHVLNDPGTVRDSMFTVPDAVPTEMGEPFAIEIAPPSGSEGLEIDLADIDGGVDGTADEIDPMITARIDGVEVEIPGSTTVLSFGTNNDESITIMAVRPSGAYVPADAEDEDEVAAAALLNGGATPIVLVSLGNAESIKFSKYVSITLEGAAGAMYVYFVDAMRTVSVIAECAEGVDADTPPSTVARTATDPNDECYLETDEGDVVIWTDHFTEFGASNVQTAARGGDGCDDCTPPTLGVDNNGVRRVSGGFSYNGDRVDALYYYTPMPLITVNVGEENTAIIKVFEDSGVDRIRHVGLAFGLSRGQHFAQSEAEIRVDISFTGETTASVSSKHNAIDADSLSVDTQKGQCMPESEAECLIVTILHTFREPLDFNVVSTVIWDDRANSWQNFFNHGIEVTGESLNPRHGIPVNDGQLVLYPIIEGHVDEDGDGIYDYDERHVTYMIDSERELYRLSHDGTYVPIRNLYGLYHEVDESMYDPTRPTSHGTLREAHSFADILAEERRIAGQIIAGMGIADPQPPVPFTPSLYAGHVEVPRAEVMASAIEAETRMAELIFERLYPSINDEIY